MFEVFWLTLHYSVRISIPLSVAVVALIFAELAKCFKRERRMFRKPIRMFFYFHEITIQMQHRFPKAMILRFIIFLYCFKSLVLTTILSSLITSNMISPRYEPMMTLDMISTGKLPFCLDKNAVSIVQSLDGRFRGMKELNKTILANHFTQTIYLCIDAVVRG